MGTTPEDLLKEPSMRTAFESRFGKMEEKRPPPTGNCGGLCACHYPFREQRKRVVGERVSAQCLLHRLETVEDEIAALKVRMGL